MITDVFDSVKFSEIENDYDTIRINKIHATAALYEALIFCPEGVLMLSAPQFFDGLAAVDKKWRSVKICSPEEIHLFFKTSPF